MTFHPRRPRLRAVNSRTASRRAESPDRTRRAARGKASTTTPGGSRATRIWPAIIFGYDGPCPPWNDAIAHRYVFTLFALDVPRLAVDGVFKGADVRKTMVGHVLAQRAVTGRYTLNPDVGL